MPYRLTVDAEFVKSYKLQHLNRIKINRDVAVSLGWEPSSTIVLELVDMERKVVILVKKEDFERLLSSGDLEIRHRTEREEL
ncbi:MAG: hypothetical protein DRN00_04045 [Thermoplasmata archaeon]|nr:MAG: hypothetical protein DRN00_04045 [Thermoplasmata archaeon]